MEVADCSQVQWHSVLMIEIMLSDGCKLGKCEVCYKYESLDGPVASVNVDNCNDPGGYSLACHHGNQGPFQGQLW